MLRSGFAGSETFVYVTVTGEIWRGVRAVPHVRVHFCVRLARGPRAPIAMTDPPIPEHLDGVWCSNAYTKGEAAHREGILAGLSQNAG